MSPPMSERPSVRSHLLGGQFLAFKYEQQEAMTGICAVAFSLDGLYGATRDLVGAPVAAKKRPSREGRVYETLKRATTNTKASSQWYDRFAAVFSLRDLATHHIPEYSTPAAHPETKTWVFSEREPFSLEEVERAVVLLREVIRSVTEKPSPPLKEWASSMSPAVGELFNLYPEPD